MTAARDDDLLLDMLIASRRAIKLAEATTRIEFAEDDVLQLASMRLIQIVGEAARQISAEGRARLPNIPWPNIIGMRHRLVHNYFDIDIQRVWEVLHDDLPLLISGLEPIVPSPEEDE